MRTKALAFNYGGDKNVRSVGAGKWTRRNAYILSEVSNKGKALNAATIKAGTASEADELPLPLCVERLRPSKKLWYCRSGTQRARITCGDAKKLKIQKHFGRLCVVILL